MCKKNISLILSFFLLISLTACSNNIGINPAGILQHINEATQPAESQRVAETDDLELEDEVESDLEPMANPRLHAVTRMDDGILRLSMRPPITLNPLLNEDVTVAPILRLIFEPLITLDEEMRPVGNIADLQFASDFSSVLLTIGSDVLWSDGLPVTSDDVIFSIETLRRAPANVIYKNNVSNISQVQRIDSRTVRIFFTQASLTAGKALNFPIIPQHHYQNENNPRSTRNMNPLGNGPFMFESHTPMRSISLVRNPNSFRSRAQIEEVEVIFLPDSYTELHAFDQGRIDVLHLPLTEWVRHHSVRPSRHETFPAMYFEFIGFNTWNDIFHDVHNRQAIAHAFNLTTTVSQIYLAQAVPSVTPIHPYTWASTAVNPPVFDPARAKALLGTINPEYPLVIIANEENTQRASIANILARSLTDVGLPTVAEVIPSNEYFARLQSRDFDLYIGGVTMSFIPDVRFLFGGGFYFNDPLLDNLFLAMKSATTESAYIQAISQFNQTFSENLPVIGLAFRHSAIHTSMRVQAGIMPTPDHIFANINTWVISS